MTNIQFYQCYYFIVKLDWEIVSILQNLAGDFCGKTADVSIQLSDGFNFSDAKILNLKENSHIKSGVVTEIKIFASNSIFDDNTNKICSVRIKSSSYGDEIILHLQGKQNQIHQFVRDFNHEMNTLKLWHNFLGSKFYDFYIWGITTFLVSLIWYEAVVYTKNYSNKLEVIPSENTIINFFGPFIFIAIFGLIFFLIRKLLLFSFPSMIINIGSRKRSYEKIHWFQVSILTSVISLLVTALWQQMKF